jgi:cytochrome c556
MGFQRTLTALAVVAATFAALPAAAQFAKPEDAVKYRKGAMNLMSTHLTRVFAVVQGRVPYDAAAVQGDVDLIVTLSRLPYVAFVDGTSSTEKLGAKANIWTDRANFDASARKMQGELLKLQTAARSGNLDNVKSAAGAVGGACKGCHDDYRN